MCPCVYASLYHKRLIINIDKACLKSQTRLVVLRMKKIKIQQNIKLKQLKQHFQEKCNQNSFLMPVSKPTWIDKSSAQEHH